MPEFINDDQRIIDDKKMSRESFTLPMDHPIAIENIRRHISPITVWENHFTPEELDWIWKQAFLFDGSNPRFNKNGTVLIAGSLERIYFKLKDKFDKMLGPTGAKTPSVAGNFFLTPQQYGLHNDSIRPEDYYPYFDRMPLNAKERKYTCWKNVLIPLWFGSHLPDGNGGHIVFFDQRHIDWAHIYNNGNSTPSVSSVYKIAYDYEELQFHDGQGKPIPKEKNKVPFDKENFEKYMNTPYKRLEGLSVESALDWIPGNTIIFDAVQLHCSNEGRSEKRKKMWNAKMGIFLTFLIELDEDLLELWRKEQKNM